MIKYTHIILLLVCFSSASISQKDYAGYFDFTYSETTGNIHLKVDKLDKEFLYVNALAAGVGSNDLGFDRGKLGDTRIVKFIKTGNKILLLQPNQKYRANSDNIEEVRAVEEAFAQSILWGFDIVKYDGSSPIIDLTPFLLSDANGLAKQLESSKQGKYKLEKSRNAVYLEGTFAFPKNVEFESYLTYVGEPKGKYIKSVTPSAESVTVRQHQSFIELPDDKYTPRLYHPYSGYFDVSYQDYATPIHQPLTQRYIVRHRLEKKNSSASISEAVEPIIYYLDSGCPEPVRSALIEGATWWNQAFEAAGYKDAFQVKVLPDDAHPLDVRYNVIQWVHRSTRGWSYGASVTDPRTGEIIKGHVSLGSLRVRQDFMIAQGLLSSYTSEEESHQIMTEMALARLRQLSAHEVGHTIGLAHNFAASTNDRASVMDYPHPMVTLTAEKQLDFSKAYDGKIGLWDKRAVVYGYSQITDHTQLQDILTETASLGLDFMSDPDARPMGSSHPKAHLWDNGSEPVAELERIMKLRSDALNRFGESTITAGTPYSELEKVLVPVYLMHRYQVEAASKIIGGLDYSYAIKGMSKANVSQVSRAKQNKATYALLKTLRPKALAVPESILKILPPPAYGYRTSRESFGSRTGRQFDPLYAAESYANFTLHLMLHPDRLSRLYQQDQLQEYFTKVQKSLFDFEVNSTRDEKLAMIPQKLYIIKLVKLLKDKSVDKQVHAHILQRLEDIKQKSSRNRSPEWKAHTVYIHQIITGSLEDIEEVQLPSIAKMPPGSPIGCGE